jgi:hypothetical protein
LYDSAASLPIFKHFLTPIQHNNPPKNRNYYKIDFFKTKRSVATDKTVFTGAVLEKRTFFRPSPGQHTQILAKTEWGTPFSDSSLSSTPQINIFADRGVIIFLDVTSSVVWSGQ